MADLDGLGVLLLALMAVALLSLLLGVRYPVIAKVGFRSFLRGRRRTVLLVLGLVVGTLIVSSSLVVGATVGTVAEHAAYVSDGAVHEAIFAPNATSPVSPYAGIPYGFYLDLNRSLRSIPDVAGVSPLIVSTVSGLDHRSDLDQAGMNLIGADGNTSYALGPFTTTTGAGLPGPGPGDALLDPNAARDLGAAPGDPITLVGSSGVPESFTVEALVQADYRGGFQDGGQGDVFVSLAAAESLTGSLSHVNFIAVTNSGGVVGGVAHTDTVWNALNATLAMAEATYHQPLALPSGLVAVQFLKADLASAESSVSSLSTLFLVLGLFSIIAGSVLIVGIFIMLAEERRGEMGVSRAVGMRRGQLLLAYYFEGLAYSAGAALVGTLLGVAAGFLLTEALSSFLGGGDFGSTLVQSFTVTDGNLVTAFSVGFLLTLGTILVTVAYVSRLNIVRAVRGLPEPTLRRGHYYRLAILGAALLGIALLLVAAGLPPGVPSTTALLGISLAFAGLALIASAWVRNRVAFSALGLAWVAFWAYLPAQTALVGPSHPTSLDVVFVAGIFSILGALLLYVFNADLIARGIARLLRSRPQRVPVGQLAFSYPTQRRLRTSMTLSIFALVIFVVVAVASIGAGLQGNLNGIARSQSGGFTMFGTAQTPIPDLPGDIQNNTTLAAEFSVAVPFYSTAGTLQYPGAPPNFTYRLAAAPTQVPSWENFYDQSQLNFTSTLHGMSAATVLQELQTNRSVAVVDGTFASAGAINFGASHPPLRVGEPITVEVAGTPVQVTVIGILAEVFVQVVFLNPQTLAVTLHQPYFLSFALTVKSGVNAQTALDDLKRAFFPFGLQLIDFANALAQGLQTTFAIFDLLEVFVALGLMVGIVAIGITSLRAVVERRNQIGIARALGLRQRQVLSAFLLEYGFLALVGILIGTTMGLLVAYHAAEGGGAGFLVFVVPWSNLLTVILPAFALTLLATGIPALKASRLPPADAIRYSE